MPTFGRWEPIATAPDGVVVLTFDATTTFPHQRYTLAHKSGRWRALSGGMMANPTHWMLPSPPDATPEGQ